MKLQVGVKALIKNQSNQYLFLHRTKTTPGATETFWDIPGGRIKPEEALQDALKREILEETGLELEATPKLVAAQDIFAPSADLHVVRLTYVMEGEGDVVTSDEHQATKWLSLDETQTLTLDPYLQAVFKLLD